jgi:tetratricopeptide (TPR) repeat protein
MSKAQEIFLAGIARHNAGQINEAWAFYDRALKLAPNHFEALHFKGVAALQLGRPDEAVELISRAVVIKPDIHLFHFNLGVALRAVGRLHDAKQAFLRSMQIYSGDGQAQFNLALILLDLGQYSEAEAELRQLSAKFPQRSDVIFALGQALFALLRYPEAELAFSSALAINPQSFEARLALAGVYCAEKRFDKAGALISQCLSDQPNNAQAHFLAGEVLRISGNLPEALHAFERALNCAPGHLEARMAMGNCLRELGRLKEALAVHNQLIAMAPDYSSGYCSRARNFQTLQDYESAFADVNKALEIDQRHRDAIFLRSALNTDVGNFDQAMSDSQAFLALDPENPDGHRGLAINLLREGRITEGFREYEWRLKCDDFTGVEYPGERWRGQSVLEKTLWVYPEQGFGDLFHFARFLPMAGQRVGRLVFGCHPALASIFSRIPGVSEVAPLGVELSHYDFQASLLSLPFLLGVDETNLAPQIPYITPLPERVALWAERLRRGNDMRPLIGLTWQGNPAYSTDAKRSVSLLMLEGLLRRTDCRFLSLQKEYGIEQISALPAGCNVEEIGSQFADFDDTAAVLSQLDLLITVDTAVAHLAGALGCPVWLCVPLASDWRWMRNSETSPWYPSMRIFRQNKMGDWPELLSRLTEAFAAWRGAK